jgi:glycosyltransferase involved in cell wall biosynthesis
MQVKQDRPNVGIVTFPIHESGIVPLSNLVNILKPLSGHIHLVTGNAGYAFFKESNQIQTYGIKHEGGTNTFSRITKYIWTQLKYFPILIELTRDVDFFIFFFSDEGLLIPMLTTKLLGKNVALAFPGSSVKSSRARKDVLSRPLDFLVKINCILSDTIILQSEKLIKEYGIEKHRNKILVAPEHFVDFNKFRVEKRLSERDDLVGYIGRLTEEKGILNFVRAIPKLLELREDVRFLIGGDGHLRGKIEEYLKKKNLNDKVKVVGWIPHENLPKYLNEVKLLVIPSYTEGGPLIAFEAMACGTLILGSRVGIMGDILRDGTNGFVLENNSAGFIAENILKILIRGDLSKISWNAKKTAEMFSYDSAVKRYKSIFKGFW